MNKLNSLHRAVLTWLGPLQRRDPLVVIAEQREVKERAAGVGLAADGQLPEQPPSGFHPSPVLGTHDGLLELVVEGPGMPAVRHGADLVAVRVRDGRPEVVGIQLVQPQEALRRVVIDVEELGRHDIVDTEQCRL